MKGLLFIPIISMLLYLVYVRARYGMTVSISATAKKLQYGFELIWFWVTLIAVAMPIIIVELEAGHPLFFPAGAFILLIATAPVYWEGGQAYKMHMLGSYGGIGLGIIGCLIYYPSPLTFLIIGAFIFFALSQLIDDLRTKNSTYWVEVAALVAVIGVLYFN